MSSNDLDTSYPACFDSRDQFTTWERTAAVERQARIEADIADGVLAAAAVDLRKPAFAAKYPKASICEDCTLCYQAKMIGAKRCENPDAKVTQ